jgi:hypothetical protein
MIHDRDTMQVLVHDVHTRGLASADHDAQECRVHLLVHADTAQLCFSTAAGSCQQRSWLTRLWLLVLTKHIS